MIKTLRITSVIAAILAAGLIALPTVFGIGNDEDIELFLNSPSIIDKYRQAGGEKPEPNVETSPLVAQAKEFADYLNPPPPVPSRPSVAVGTKPPIGVKPPPPPPDPSFSPKFTVVATSYYESQPDMSLVLIDEPGKGRHWIRQGAEVMHLTIEQVKEGVILVKGGESTYELAVPKVREVNLLDDGSPSADAATTTVPAPIAASHTPETAPSAAVDARTAGPRGRITGDQAPADQITEEERELAEKIFAELEALATKGGPGAGRPSPQGKVSSRPGAPRAPIPAPEATRIDEQEAEKLANLGKELKADKKTDRDRLRDPRERIDRRLQLEERRKRIEELAKRRMRENQTREDDETADQ